MGKDKIKPLWIAGVISFGILFVLLFPAFKAGQITKPADVSKAAESKKINNIQTPTPSNTPAPIKWKSHTVYDKGYSYGYTITVPENWEQMPWGAESDGTNFNQVFVRETPYCRFRIYVHHKANPTAFDYDYSDWKPFRFTNSNGIEITQSEDGIYSWTNKPHPYFWIAGERSCDNAKEIYDQVLNNFNIVTK